MPVLRQFRILRDNNPGIKVEMVRVIEIRDRGIRNAWLNGNAIDIPELKALFLPGDMERKQDAKN